MSFLKSIAKKQTALSVSDMIRLRVGGHEKARSNDPLHASDLTKEREFCPREVVLMEGLGIRRPDEFIMPELQMTFDDGRDKQSRLNNHYLRDVMVGHWKCLLCGELREFQKVPKGPCKNGHAKKWRYVEVMFTHAKAKFTGSIDSILDIGQPKLRKVEIKIMSEIPWLELKAPLAEHRLRTNLYLRLIDESEEQEWAKQINTEVSHVLYWLRGYGKKNDKGQISPFKEYVVKRDDAATDDLIERAKAVADFREGKQKHLVMPLPKGICATALCDRAEKKCPVVKQCFSGELLVGSL